MFIYTEESLVVSRDGHALGKAALCTPGEGLGCEPRCPHSRKLRGGEHSVLKRGVGSLHSTPTAPRLASVPLAALSALFIV